MNDDKKPDVIVVTRFMTCDAKLPDTSWIAIEVDQRWRRFRDSFQRYWWPQEEAK